MKKFITVGLSICTIAFIAYNVQVSSSNLSKKTDYDTPIEPGFEFQYDKPGEFYKLYKELTFKNNLPTYKSGYKIKELNKALDNQSLSSSRRAAYQFTERGPSNVPGRTRDMYIDPSDPQHKTWLAGSVGGGIWKTTDAGQTWTNKTSDLLNLATTSIAYSASNPSIIYAGTGEGWLGSAGFIGGSGIYKSTDKGESWSLLPSTASKNFEIINRLIVDPNDPNVLLALTNNDPIFGTDFFSYILKSTDGGANWKIVYQGSNFVQHIVADPTNFNTLYATVRRFGVIKSVDKGETWVSKSSGLNPSGRLEIAVSPVDPNKLYASVEGNVTFQRADGGDGSDIYTSDDAGENWVLVYEKAGKNIDYFNTQGWYDNAILAHPFDKSIVYVGGVGVFKVTVGETTVESAPTFLGAVEDNTAFMSLVNFNNGLYYGNKIAVGTDPTKFTSVEVRFGPGKTQKAHRFTVPDGMGAGVPNTDYSYQDYVDVPFQVWDISTVPNRQLMVAFRDQQRDGKFNLIKNNTTAGDENNHSREYVYISSVTYNATTPDANIGKNGGHEFNNMYFFWPYLTDGYQWNESSIPESKFVIKWGKLKQRESAIASVADVYGYLDGKNAFSQNTGESSVSGVHPDIHGIRSIIHDATAKTWQMLISNDGGVYVSDVSTDPGTTQGSIKFSGNTLNTTQFYAADKMPGADRYIGGSQDNGTWMSPDGTSDATTKYKRALGGDGFGTVWHSQDSRRLLGSIYNLAIYRSNDGGTTWTESTDGITDEGPFITKIENSHAKPNVVFTAGESGVWRSENFGGSWKVTPIATKWALSSSFNNIEISEASPDVVWAGSRMDASGLIFVSTDNGKTFNATKLYTGAELGVVSGIASHPVDYKTAYALFSYSETPKVLRTTDLGQTWEDISGFVNGVSTNGFPDVAVLDLVVMPHDPNIIWVGTEIGIFESTDNGVSWHILNGDIPKVSIWDMNFNDDQLVIATHGRGIWTYTLPSVPDKLLSPTIKNVTKNLESNQFLVEVQLVNSFDSVQVFVNGTKSGVLTNPAIGAPELKISGSFTGSKITFSAIGYRSAATFSSESFDFTNFSFLSILDSYKDDLNSDKATFIGNLAVRPLADFANGGLQSEHNYVVSKTYTHLLKHPIRVSSSDSKMTYKDIALVEPGSSGSVFGQTEFNDFVSVEGSKNGLDWITLGSGYDASFDTKWLDAFNSEALPTQDMYVSHELDLRDYFNAGDIILIRFKLYSNASVTSWGWILDDIVIQGNVLGFNKEMNPVVLYPNPSKTSFKVQNHEDVASIKVFALDGRQVLKIERFDGQAVDVSSLMSGIYSVELTLNSSEKRRVKFIKQ